MLFSLPRWRALLAVVTLGLLSFSLQAQSPPLRVLPLGDSITDGTANGTAGRGGYRGSLYDYLTNVGYNIDYVGTLTNNGSLMVDPNHEGHSGWRIDQLDTNIQAWLNSYADPDVILMHIGTNDFGQGLDITNAIHRLDALILKIATLRPYAHIIVSNLMERTPTATDANIQQYFNPYVQGVVNAHAAAGRRVTFLDVRSVVPLSTMPDGLHPNQDGYDLMAYAWLGALQAVIDPDGDNQAPGLYRATASSDRVHVSVTFSKPMADSAAQASHFVLSGGLTVTDAVLDATKRVVVLTTSQQALQTSYTLTVNQVQDRKATPNNLPANSSVTFNSSTARGYANNVNESADYTLLYSLDLPTLPLYQAAPPAYTVDNHTLVSNFDRVAYYLELQSAGGDLQYMWVSMDPFTTDSSQLGVPTLSSGGSFQTNVTNMNVISNVAGVATGNGLGGSIEFWPGNYSAANGASVPGASDTLYDFGDTMTAGNYGSMQIHNPAAAQTILAFNNWGGSTTTTNADLGIGNGTGAQPDWTFSNNAGNYTIKSLQVLVRTVGDLTPPTILKASATYGRSTVIVNFSKPVSAASLNAINFTLSGGVQVLGLTLAPNQRDVYLTTTAQPTGTALTLAVSGVRDTSPNANALAAGTTVNVAPLTLPAAVLSNVGAAANNFELVASIDLPVVGNLNALGSAAYTVDDRSANGAPFSRVAYYLELVKPGVATPDYVWVSMDAFTAGRSKLGVPTTATGALFQKGLTNLEVFSNVAGVTTGKIATGNIEFWPSNYTAAKATGSPSNASDTNYDFGDSGASTAAGHGSMQIHNSTAGQTIFAVNHFGQDGSTLDIGIGNDPSPVKGGVDWTFSATAVNYTRRTLHVMVLPGVTTDPAIVARIPEAAGYQLAATVNIPAAGNLNNANIYAVDNRADLSRFSRVAYYMELHKPGDPATSYVWASMDAFTTDVTKIAVPTTASAAVWQQNVSNLNVFSNVSGVVNGTGITTGNLEFWPSSYTAANSANVLGASGTVYDFGDSGGTTTAGHGSLQVHNYGAGQTLLSITNWGSTTSTTNVFGMGIGNNPSAGVLIGSNAQGLDWTFAANSGAYDSRLLAVYVLPGNSDTTAPLISKIAPSSTLRRLIVTFSKPVADTAANPALYSLNGGVSVTGATLLANKTDVVLTTGAQTAASAYLLTVSGVRDRTPAGNVITPASTASFTAYSAPAVLANVLELANYTLAYQVALPSASPKWNATAVPYTIDESRYGELGFDRVAYVMQLDSNWACASFDAFTTSIGKIGIPTSSVSATPFQQNVTNLNVSSNVAGLATGTALGGGNIEFWNGNFTQANALNIPNASATLFDFGDTMTTANGYGCLQIHNHDASQTIMAYNDWGSNTATCDLGIGNNPNAGAAAGTNIQGSDWTFAANAASYTNRTLYVLVHPAAAGTPPALLSQAGDRGATAGTDLSLGVTLLNPGSFSYQWRLNGVAIAGATNAWLDIHGLDPTKVGACDVVVTSATGAATTSRPAQVAINNHPPTFRGYSFTLNRNEIGSINLAQILAKATDPDGDTLTFASNNPGSTQGGQVARQGAALLYTPPANFLGSDTFQVNISDAKGGLVAAQVTAQVTGAQVSAIGQPTLGTHTGGGVDVVFNGAPGQSYVIERSTDLSHWSTLQTATPGDDGALPATDPAPPAGRTFYRARLGP